MVVFIVSTFILPLHFAGDFLIQKNKLFLLILKKNSLFFINYGFNINSQVHSLNDERASSAFILSDTDFKSFTYKASFGMVK